MKGCTIKFYFVVLFLSVLTSAEAGVIWKFLLLSIRWGIFPPRLRWHVSSVVGLPFQLCTQENGKPRFGDAETGGGRGWRQWCKSLGSGLQSGAETRRILSDVPRIDVLTRFALKRTFIRKCDNLSARVSILAL